MTVWHPPQPPNTQRIWRYLSLAAFIWMLENRSIFCPTLAQLRKIDPMEGLFTEDNIAAAMIGEREDFDVPPPTPEAIATAQSAMRMGMRVNQYQYLATCWYANDDESAAMWKLYGTGDHNVAIYSTVGELVASITINQDDTVRIEKKGLVEYDIHSPSFRYRTPIKPLFHKDSSLSHEREYRILFYDRRPHEFTDGRGIPVKLESLIRGVIISPYAPSFFAPVVRSVMNRYEMNESLVSLSRLRFPPKPIGTSDNA